MHPIARSWFVALGVVVATPARVTGQISCCDHYPDPSTVVTFADGLIRYVPGWCVVEDPDFKNPLAALGAPDYDAGKGAVSLAHGGFVEVLFINSKVTNSGDPSADLYLWEVGPNQEATYIAVRPANAATRTILDQAGKPADAFGFYSIGRLSGTERGKDLDAWVPGLMPGALKFDAARVTDDDQEDSSCGGDGGSASPGADIDAVGATTSCVSPECVTAVPSISWGRIKLRYR
jgi:hypothetical protein